MKKQDIKIIHEMLQQGKNATEISLVLGIPSSTIRPTFAATRNSTAASLAGIAAKSWHSRWAGR